jgi:glycosyltransferase involved in cell wall biosynthesis
MLGDITPLILTFEEAPNIERTLRQLAWARRVVVVDSFSTDGTPDLARCFPQVEIIQRRFDTFAGQCNFGLTQIHTPWVLSLDADYVLSDGLLDEIQHRSPVDDFVAYRVAFKYCVEGYCLRASLYPPRVVLYQKEKAHYEDEGHGHRVRVEGGKVADLNGVIFHDDRKPLRHWLNSQDKYACIEAEHLLRRVPADLNLPDRIRRKIWIAPWIVFFHTLFGKRVILDGWPGFYYALQRMLFETLLSLRLIELKWQRNEEQRAKGKDL